MTALTTVVDGIPVTISMVGLTIDRAEARAIIRVVAKGSRAGHTAHEIVRAVDKLVGHLVGIEDAAVVAQRAKVAVATREFGRVGRRAAGCCASDRLTVAKCRCGEE